MTETGYKIHLSTVSSTPEVADQLFREFMKQLNYVTRNGEHKITEVKQVNERCILIFPDHGRDVNPFMLRTSCVLRSPMEYSGFLTKVLALIEQQKEPEGL